MYKYPSLKKHNDEEKHRGEDEESVIGVMWVSEIVAIHSAVKRGRKKENTWKGFVKDMDAPLPHPTYLPTPPQKATVLDSRHKTTPL